MPTDGEIRWLKKQPLAVQLAAVEKVWQQRADQMVLICDQLWAVGKTVQALDKVVAFAAAAADTVERLGKSTDFGRFGRERIRDIAGNALLTTAVVHEISIGRGEQLDTEPLMRVCERLGVVP